MAETRWFSEPNGAFEVPVPAGWTAALDAEDGAVLLAPAEGAGSLHLLAFAGPLDEPADPAEELFAFLDEEEVELEEDDVEDVELGEGAALALCEYLTEDEDDAEGATFWLMAVATAPGALVFASYSCPAGEEDAEREAVRAVLAGLRLRARH